MVTETYIGKIKSEGFDFNIPCEEKFNTGYSPKPIIYVPDHINGIYMDIVHAVIDKKENAKQTDWGCFTIKMNKEDLLKYLSKYDKEAPELENNPVYLKEREEYKNFLNEVEKLGSEEEYLLAAKEIM
jgi:hypothetical protein